MIKKRGQEERCPVVRKRNKTIRLRIYEVPKTKLELCLILRSLPERVRVSPSPKEADDIVKRSD